MNEHRSYIYRYCIYLYRGPRTPDRRVATRVNRAAAEALVRRLNRASLAAHEGCHKAPLYYVLRDQVK